MDFERALLDDLWNGEKSICMFVFQGACYWVLDDKYNFSLDAEKDYQAYLEKGRITEEQFIAACREFRFGVLKMSSDNFQVYLSGVQERVFSAHDLAAIIASDEEGDGCEIYAKVEEYYLSGKGLTRDDFLAANKISSRLPQFYINFDRRIYMHMDFGRCHEDLSYPDWLSRYADFNFLIPVKERYWAFGGDDYWKFRYL